MTSNSSKPWDAQLAYLLVKPLKDSWVTPNHLTTVRLLTGVLGAVAIAISAGTGKPFFWSNVGGILFMLSAFIDHTDGELARLSGKSTAWGHVYDLISDAIVLISLFLSIGIATMDSSLGGKSIPMSVIASVAVSGIFYLMNDLELKLGKESARQPHILGLEAEDILYLFPLVTLFQSLVPFLILATIGSPLFAIYMIWDYRQTLAHVSVSNRD